MCRWLEQVEQKMAELLRTSRSFYKMKDIWAALSLLQPIDLPGHVAYAKKKANMYSRMKQECDARMDEVGYGELRLKSAEDSGYFLTYLLSRRAEHAAYLQEQVALQVALHTPETLLNNSAAG
jgi:hypothetical protein